MKKQMTILVLCSILLCLACRNKDEQLFSYDLYDTKEYERKFNLNENETVYFNIEGNIDFIEEIQSSMTIRVLNSNNQIISFDTLLIYPLETSYSNESSGFPKYTKREFSGRLTKEISIKNSDRYTFIFKILDTPNIYRINKAKIFGYIKS